MTGSKTEDERQREGGLLANYRDMVERLHHETEAEFGGQPVCPEMAATVALALASIVLVVLMTPAIAVTPQVWHIAVALIVVWLAAFRFQAGRYSRFQDRLQRKIRAYIASPEAIVG